jgi:copper chaperone CopZ
MMSSTTDNTGKTSELTKKKRLYILTDDGFAPQLALHLMFLGLLVTACASIPSLRSWTFDVYFGINDWMMATAHRYAWWSLLGLLSSSCCALQLLLNAMSMGCAGFNTVLGPIRPTLLALTVTVQAISWYVAWSRPWQWAPTAASTVLVVGLSLLPEALAMCSTGGGISTKKQREGMQRNLATTGATGSTDSSITSTTLVFKMNSVGCAACVITVSRVLDGISGVVDYKACLEAGTLTVIVCNKDSNDTTTNKRMPKVIMEKLEEAGFPMELF